MADRPFRFGVSVHTASSRVDWAEKARRAEAMGYSTLLLPDHLLDCLPPLVPLASAAEATTTLRVGTFVLNNDFRHPVVLAREAAAVDLLTDGRLELGLGAGHMRSEYDEAGLPFDPPAVRVARLAESVAIVSRLLAGETVTFNGQHYQVSGHQIYPLPRQRPRPPLLIGGNGRRLLSLAAHQADIVGLSGLSHRRGGSELDLAGFKASAVDHRLAWLRAASGPRFDQLELNALIQQVVVTDTPRRAAAEIASRWTDLDEDDVMQTPYLLIGSLDGLAETLLARRERWGLSYYVVFEAAAEPLAPLVARLAGI
jgi:probable F420-dependent oxidoreductase